MHVRTDVWNQLGGNPAGSGFRFVNSIVANSFGWGVPLGGPSGTSSPVVGPDGTIYIGTSNGRLVATDPKGSSKWGIEIADSPYAVQTPAVADDGTIYCLCTMGPPISSDHRTERGTPSFVVSVSSNGQILWRRPTPALPDLLGTVHCGLYGAPRILSGPQFAGGPGIARVFFVVRYTLTVNYPEIGGRGPSFVRVLLIVDEHGTFLLFNRYEEYKLFVDAHGEGGGGDATLTDPEPSGGLPKGVHSCADTPVVYGSFPPTEPWTIVAPGDKGLYALRWSEQERALAGAPTLFPLTNPFPAPVAFPNDLLVGTVRDFVTFIDPNTFTRYLPNAMYLGGTPTVAGGGRQMYFVLRFGALLAVDTNGTLWKRSELKGGSVAFPALSLNHIHVSAAEGVQTFLLDLQEIASVGSADSGTHGGLSSPAIGPNGEVYAAFTESSISSPDVDPSLHSFLFELQDASLHVSLDPSRPARQ